MYTKGMYGLDSASTLNYPAAKAAGSNFQVRYSAGAGNSDSKTQWKLCKIGEIASIIAAGLDFCANSEWYTTRVTEGAASGRTDGAADLSFWKSRGLAQGSTIYPSWDSAPIASQFNNVAAYLTAYNAALGGYYKCDGFYAGIPALLDMERRGITKHFWIPESTDWSGLPENYYEPTKAQVGPFSTAVAAKCIGASSAIWQTGNHWFGTSADEDIVVVAGWIGSHRESLEAIAPKPPAPKPLPVPAGPSRMSSPSQLMLGQSIVSPSKHYAAMFQTDGNFVVRNLVTGAADWNTGTMGKGANVFAIQDDGNLVIRTPNGVLWSSNTAAPAGTKKPIFLQQQDDGNLVAYLASDGKTVVWSFR